MKSFLLLAGAAGLLSAASCQKDPVDPLRDLPEATQTGANTIGCLVNGQRMEPVTDAFNADPIHVIRFPSGRLEVYFTHNKGKLNRLIILSVPRLRQAGTYALNQPANPSFPTINPAYGYYSTYNPEPDSRYLTGPTARGQLIVTRFDSVAQIVAGTFEFTAQHTSGPDTVRVTHGRFDLHYPQ